MDIKFVIEKIINIPKDYYGKNKSKYSLVKESGYFEVYDKISEDVIEKALKEKPELIAEWIGWSEDQRISEGWYLKIENGKNIVANFSNDGGYKEIITTYPDISTACSVFIKYEIEYSRKIALLDTKKNKKI